MLKKGDKVLNFTDKNDPDVKQVLDLINDLKKKCWGRVDRMPVLMWTNIHRSEVVNDEESNTKKFEYATSFKALLHETVYDETGMATEWRYYDRVEKDRDGERYYPKRFDFRGAETQALTNELLFFLVFVSPHCELIPSLSKYQNNANTQKHWKVDMPEIEAANSAELAKLSYQVGNFIYSKLDDSSLRTIAKAMGVSGTDSMQINQVKNALNVIATSSRDNMEQFLKETNVNPATTLKSDLQTAKDRNIIRFDKRPNQNGWRYVEGNTMAKEYIVKVVPGQDADNTLYDFYCNHQTDYEVLKQKINDKQ